MTLNQHFNDLLKDSKNMCAVFKEMADLLFATYCFEAGDKKYFFTEIEFYYHSKDHPDPFCKRTPQNSSKLFCPEVPSDNLFFHYSGIDISFDNDEKDKTKHQYGGILVRAIESADGKEAVNGPLKVMTLLLNAARQKEGVRLVLKEEARQYVPKPSLCRGRFGLTANDGAKRDYVDRPYRYYLPGTKGVKAEKLTKK